LTDESVIPEPYDKGYPAKIPEKKRDGGRSLRAALKAGETKDSGPNGQRLCKPGT